MKTYPKFKNNNFFSKRSVLVALLFVMASVNLKAADYFWVGGSGNWSDYAGHWATTSGGSIFHTTIPTINDDVYFDANSFTAANQSVTLDNTFIYCKNMDWTGALNTPAIDGINNTLYVYGSLTLNSAMDWNVRRVDFSSALTGETITTAGQALDTIYIKGAGAFSLSDDLVAKSVIIENGSFATAGNTVTVNKFIVGVLGATVNVDLGTSTLNISDIFQAYYGTINMISANSNLNFVNPVVAKLYLWATGQTFNDVYFQIYSEVVGHFNCQDLTADGPFYINGNWANSSCTNATFASNVTLDCNFTANTLNLTSTDVFLKLRTATINSTFTANGICGQPIVIQPVDFFNSATLTVPTGTVTVEYATITSIVATGGATFIANNSVDGGNNAGWTINAAAARTLYWVGGTGNWEDDANWSLTSGGAGGNCIPSLLDDVIFDANSFSQSGEVVTINNSPANCKNMDWTGVSLATEIEAPGTGSIILYGSIALSSSVNWNVYTMQFSGAGTGNTILTAGVNLQSVVVNGSGTWSLADEVFCLAIGVQEGTLNTDNHDIHAQTFFANGNNAAIFADLGTSTLYLSERYMAFSNLITVNSSNANLVLDGGFPPIEVQTNDANFNTITALTPAYIGKVTCNRFDAFQGVTLTDLTALTAEFRASFDANKITADSLILQQGVQQMAFDTIVVNDEFITNTSCDSPLKLQVYYPFISQASFSKATGTVQLDYTYLKGIDATGGATFIANNSWDLGNNSGWTINTAASRDLYWVGGTGSWNESSNWSLTSGGAGGNCQPGFQDNAIFDANSFASAGDTVFVNPTNGVYCNNLTFTGIPSPTTLWSSSSNAELNISGSVTLPQELNLYSVLLNMNGSTTGNTISTGGNNLTKLSVTGTGEWTLLDALDLGNFGASNGTLNTNGYSINTGGINAGGNAVLNFGTSTVTALGVYMNSGTLTVNASDANFIMTSSWLSFEVQNADFGSVTFTGDANTVGTFSCDYLNAQGNFVNANSQITAGRAEFNNNVTLTLPFIADSLILNNPGDLVLFSNITINDALIANSNSGFPIQLEGNAGGGILSKSSGQVCLDYMLLKNTLATGGAQFFAGANSVDLGGNAGWSFLTCVPPASNVWPGDANYDLVADNTDILNIGLAYGYSGPVRAGASLAWTAQPASDWSTQFANGANLKHADTDGSGLVDSDDTTAVSLNYGLTHPFRLQNPGTSQLPSPVLYITTNPDTANTSDTVEVSIYLGTSTVPVDSIYGIAFTVNLDTSLVNTSYLSADFSGSWLGTQQVDLLAFHKDLMTDGKVDIALVRTDQQNTTGFGYLGRLGIVIVDNVGAKVTLPVTLSDITAITASEYILSVTFQNDSVIIDTTGTVGIQEQWNLNDLLSVYPNPASDFVQINSGDFNINDFTVYNQFGNVVGSETINTNRFRLSTRELAQGVYTIKLNTDKGVVVKKFLVVRK